MGFSPFARPPYNTQLLNSTYHLYEKDRLLWNEDFEEGISIITTTGTSAATTAANQVIRGEKSLLVTSDAVGASTLQKYIQMRDNSLIRSGTYRAEFSFSAIMLGASVFSTVVTVFGRLWSVTCGLKYDAATQLWYYLNSAGAWVQVSPITFGIPNALVRPFQIVLSFNAETAKYIQAIICGAPFDLSAISCQSAVIASNLPYVLFDTLLQGTTALTPNFVIDDIQFISNLSNY